MAVVVLTVNLSIDRLHCVTGLQVLSAFLIFFLTKRPLLHHTPFYRIPYRPTPFLHIFSARFSWTLGSHSWAVGMATSEVSLPRSIATIAGTHFCERIISSPQLSWRHLDIKFVAGRGGQGAHSCRKLGRRKGRERKLEKVFLLCVASVHADIYTKTAIFQLSAAFCPLDVDAALGETELFLIPHQINMWKQKAGEGWRANSFFWTNKKTKPK